MTGPVGAVNIPPDHYETSSGIQPFDVIDEYDLGFYQGNAFKYIVRAGRKGDYNGDLAKAVHYLEESILRLPQYHTQFDWVAVPWIEEGLEPGVIIESFGVSGSLEVALNCILEAAQEADTETVEYLLRHAIKQLEILI